MTEMQLVTKKLELANLDTNGTEKIIKYSFNKHEILLKCMFSQIKRDWLFNYSDWLLEIWNFKIDNKNPIMHFPYDKSYLDALEQAIDYIIRLGE